MTSKKLIKNQNGFSLVNLVVGLGIASIVMGGFAAAIQMMNRAKQTSDVKTEASLFVDSIQQTLKRPNSCQTNLAGNIMKIDGSENPVTLGWTSTGTEIAKGVKVMKMSMKTSGNPIAAPGAAGTYSMNATLELQVADASVDPPLPLRSRFIPLLLTVTGVGANNQGVISKCGSIDSSAEVCAQLDGVWDPNAPVGLQCVPTDRCLYAGSYSNAPHTGTDANGAPNPGFINTYTGNQTCPQYFSAQQTGSVQVARKASKYKVVTDTYPVYTCVRCQKPVANQAIAGALSTGVDLDAQGNADIIDSYNEGDEDVSNIDSIWDKLRL